jgi:hypothetical protein
VKGACLFHCHVHKGNSLLLTSADHYLCLFQRDISSETESEVHSPGFGTGSDKGPNKFDQALQKSCIRKLSGSNLSRVIDLS